MFCSNCGKEIDESVKFFSNCGTENVVKDNRKKDKTNLNKKLLIIVIAILVVVLIICVLFFVKNNQNSQNSQEISIEEKMKNADYIQWEVLKKDMDENKARAKEKYENNYYIGEVFISKIESSYCYVYVKNNIGEYMRSSLILYLPEEDLIKINQGDRVQIITKIHIGASVLPDLNGNVIKVFPKEQ